jgi:hypothetical protein
MLIYEIPYDGNKHPNSLVDLLGYIRSTSEEYCLFKISYEHEKIYLKFSEKFIDYFSIPIEEHAAKRLNKLPSFDEAVILGGNSSILTKK